MLSIMIKQFEFRTLQNGMPEEGQEVLGLLKDGEESRWAIVYYDVNRWFYSCPPEGFPDHLGGKTYTYGELDFSIPMDKPVVAWAPLSPATLDQ